MFWTECKDLQEDLVCMRRDLHKIPELGTNLPKTQAYIIAKLEEYGIPYKLNKGDSGLVATIKGKKNGKVIALRADMDALPIQEENAVDYVSTHDGCMHACGHDAHITMLLGAAKVLNAHKSKLSGEVRLLFQTGEEICKGAKVLVAEGAMEGVDAVFGTHIGSIIDRTIPQGKFIICPGPVMASFDRFIIKVKGIGCHGSTPEKGVDPVNIAAHIVIALEAVNAREFNACVPVVLTIGMIKGGYAYNAIPSEVLIEGTTRTFDDDVRKKVAQRIGEISQMTAAAFGGSVEFEMDWGAPPVVNVPEMAKFAAECAAEVVGVDNIITSRPSPNMAGEDFAYLLAEAPGAFMFLSSANPAKGSDIPHHNPKFKVDEDVLWMGSAAFVNLAEKFLQ
ncbi:MAG: amidohydrolase [Mogibacterium sp.]|nr:amidohydrolase [Mogibacterium sp.]